MQGCDDRSMGSSTHRKAEKIQVRMDDVILPGPGTECPFQREDQRRIAIDELVLMETKGLGTTGIEVRRGLGVSAGKQCDVMTLTYQFLRQVGHNPFCSSIELWRNTFPQGRQLGDLHGRSFL